MSRQSKQIRRLQQEIECLKLENEILRRSLDYQRQNETLRKELNDLSERYLILKARLKT